MTDQQAAAPALRIVRGNPSAEEVAALLGVVLALGSGAAAEPEPAAAPWAATARMGRRAPRPSPSAWRLSMRTF